MPIYVPLLKSKQGELAAIKDLDPAVRSELFPVFDIPPVVWDYDDDAPAKTLDDHIAKVPENLRKSLGGIACAIDVKWLDATVMMASGVHPLTWLLDELRQRGVVALPVVGPGTAYPPACIAAAKQAIATDKRGCIVRVGAEYLFQPSLAAQLTALLAALGIKAADAHLLVDLETIAAGAVPSLAYSVPAVVAALPQIQSWRSLILAGTSFPGDLQGLGVGLHSIPRYCWAIWNQVFASTIARKPLFGDYAVDGHDRSEPDVNPKFMKGSTNVRYTSAIEWLVFKGPNSRDHGFTPMRGLCTQLIADARYCQPPFSWGDAYIDGCAQGTNSTGMATTWRRVGVNHHLTYVVRQLASQSAPSAVF